MAVLTWRPLSATARAKVDEGIVASKRATFRAPTAQTVGELMSELDDIGVLEATVELEIPKEIADRLGRNRFPADATITGPRVVLSYRPADALPNSPPVIMPGVRFTEWADNLRGVMLTLRALRAIDRYGVTGKGEQYKGFTAIPATALSLAPTPDQAAARLEALSGYGAAAILSDAEVARQAIFKARRRVHPDTGAKGAGEDELARVNEAARVIGAHHGDAFKV